MALTFRIGLGSRASLHKGFAYFQLEDGGNAAAELRPASRLTYGHLYEPERVECCGRITIVNYYSDDFERAGHRVELAREASSCSGFIDAQFDAGALIAALLIWAERGRPRDADELAPHVASASIWSD